MEEIKKYYWIRLKTNFFDRDEIDFLMSQKNGSDYVLIYLMLCLKSISNHGKLVTENGKPYDVETLSADLKYFSSDTIKEAVTILKDIGLIRKSGSSTLVISNFSDIVW